MKFVNNGSESLYRVSREEKDACVHWLDTVLAASAAEDVTDQFVVTNFIEDDKVRQTDAGSVVAVMKRLPLPGATSPEDITDVVISGGEVWEGNLDKGIVLNVANPEPGNCVTIYDMQLTHAGFVHERYDDRMRVSATLPGPGSEDYRFRVEPHLQRHLPNRLGNDIIHYTIRHDTDEVAVTVALDPTDMVRGQVRPRPLNEEEESYMSLGGHVRYISRVLGIEFPDFLQQQ